jgi:hypothetical protein
MYTHNWESDPTYGTGSPPLFLFSLPTSLVGDAAITTIIQCILTWLIPLVLVNLDLAQGRVAPIGFVPEPTSRWVRCLFLLDQHQREPNGGRKRPGQQDHRSDDPEVNLDEETQLTTRHPTDHNTANGGTKQQGISVITTTAVCASSPFRSPSPSSPSRSPQSPDSNHNRNKTISNRHHNSNSLLGTLCSTLVLAGYPRGAGVTGLAWFVLGQLGRGLLLAVGAFGVLIGPTIGVLAATGTRYGGDWVFPGAWAGPVFKLVYGGVLGLLTSPTVALFWMVRAGWLVNRIRRDCGGVLREP